MTQAQRIARSTAVAVLVLLVAPYVFLWSRLPEPVATHWGSAGEPNGSMSRIASLLLVVGIWLLVAGRQMLPREASAETPTYRWPPFTMMFLVAAVLLSTTGVVTWANLDARDWAAAKELPSSIFLPALLVLVIAATGLGRWLERRQTPPSRQTGALATVDLRAEESAVWFGHGHNYVLLVFLIGLSMYSWTRPGGGAWRYLLTALPLVTGGLLCWVSVMVRDDKVEISFAPWKWPRKQVKIADIAEAAVEHVQPMRYGGWGYRVCGTRCRAIIVRRGDALRLKMNDGKSLIVTVDHADEAAGLVNDLKARRVAAATRPELGG